MPRVHNYTATQALYRTALVCHVIGQFTPTQVISFTKQVNNAKITECRKVVNLLANERYILALLRII